MLAWVAVRLGSLGHRIFVHRMTMRLIWMEANTRLNIEMSHGLFGRCVHIVHRIPLFIGEGIKHYLCFYPSNKSMYPWESWCSKCIYCVLFLVYVQIVVTGIVILQLFYSLYSLLSPQTVFLHRLMEIKCNLYTKLLPLHCLPKWFWFTTNKNRTTFVLLCSLTFVWKWGTDSV